MMRSAQREFTGRKMLASMLAFFGVIIAVNLTMATFAGRSWTGFVVRNSYVASQEFNGKVAAARDQAALGWTASLAIANGEVRYGLVDKEGRAVAVRGGTVTFKRPSYEAEDMTVTLTPSHGAEARAEAVVRDGLWIVEVAADVGHASPYREMHRIVVSRGAMQ